jgi:hypothetical protein
VLIFLGQHGMWKMHHQIWTLTGQAFIRYLLRVRHSGRHGWGLRMKNRYSTYP